MNAKPLSAFIFPFVPVGGPAYFADWQTGADIDRGVGDRDYLDSLAGIPREGCPAAGVDPEDYRKRYKTKCSAGARGTFAGLTEALNCAFGLSQDRKWVGFVMHVRSQLTDKAILYIELLDAEKR